MNRSWWKRRDLYYNKEGRLIFAGRDLSRLLSTVRTPVFFYSAERIKENILRIRKALDTGRIQYGVFFAMKANRFPPVLTYLKTTGLCGIDACSPDELLLARSCGFENHEISYTSTSFSERDLNIIAAQPDVLINCDSLRSIRGIGERCPGRRIGIRINPGIGVGYNGILRYSGNKVTKFGIYQEQFEEALILARQFHLEICNIHFHVGCGYLSTHLEAWAQAVHDALWFADQVPSVESVNLGGGLGVPFLAHDNPLDLNAWVEVIKKCFGSRTLKVYVEPGGYIVRDSGLMVLQINMIERKRNIHFIGVDGGFNLDMEPVFYKLARYPVPCIIKEHPESALNKKMQKFTIAGNINEAIDVWAEDIQLPDVKEGEYLAFLNAGGYSVASSSNHCMRRSFSEYLLF